MESRLERLERIYKKPKPAKKRKNTETDEAIPWSGMSGINKAHAVFYIVCFGAFVFLATSGSYVLLTMLWFSRVEYRAPVSWWFFNMLWVTLVFGAALPDAGILLKQSANKEGVFARRAARAFSMSPYVVAAAAAALLAWGTYMHVTQRTLYCDYIMTVTLCILILMGMILSVNWCVVTLIRCRGRVDKLVKFAYIGMFLLGAEMVVACWFCPIGPMSYNWKHHAWLLHPCKRVAINSKTLRGPEFPAVKPPGVRRIALMGDSSTFGLWYRYEDTYAKLLADKLNAAPGRRWKYEVINAGVPTHRVNSVVQRYKQAVRPYDPDILVIYAGHNDARAAPKLFRQRVMYIINDAKAKKLPVIIATYPHLSCTPGMHALANEVRGLARDENLYLIDLEMIMNHDPRVFCMNGIHPNKEGHKLVAEKMYEMVLRAEKFMKPVAADRQQQIKTGQYAQSKGL